MNAFMGRFILLFRPPLEEDEEEEEPPLLLVVEPSLQLALEGRPLMEDPVLFELMVLILSSPAPSSSVSTSTTRSSSSSFIRGLPIPLQSGGESVASVSPSEL